jgi:hypothetical protein
MVSSNLKDGKMPVQENKSEGQQVSSEIRSDVPDDRRRNSGDRRHMACKGFAYISTVGWICRREKQRRASDQSNEC